jgi:hypothetical protein
MAGMIPESKEVREHRKRLARREVGNREQMVLVALRNDWIHDAERVARSKGCTDPVVLLIAKDALDAFPLKFSSPPHDRVAEQIQRKAGCRKFIVGTVKYADLLGCNAAENWQKDVEEMKAKGGTSVVAITREGQFLASVSPVSKG